MNGTRRTVQHSMHGAFVFVLLGFFAVLSTLMEHTPAGLILSPAEGSDATLVRQALGANANVLLFNRELDGADWDFLTLDNQHGAYLATRHLIESGRRKLVYVSDYNIIYSTEHRMEGFRKACEDMHCESEAGLEQVPER